MTSEQDRDIERLRRAGLPARRGLIDLLAARAAARSQTDREGAIADWEEAAALLEQSEGRTAEWRTFWRRVATVREPLHDLLGAAAALDKAKPPDGAAADEIYSWANSRAIMAERLSEWQLTTTLYDIVVIEFDKLESPGPNSPFGLSNAATWAAGSGDVAKAESILARLKRAQSEIPGNAITYEVAMVEAQIARGAGDLLRADRAWQEVTAIAQSTGQDSLLPSIAEVRSDLLREMGKPEEAVDLLRPFVVAAGDEPAVAVAPHQLAAAIALGELLASKSTQDNNALNEAREVLRRSLAGEITRGMPEAEWRLFAALADVCAALGFANSAILLGKAAVDIIARIEDTAPVAPALIAQELDRRLLPHRKLIGRLVEAGRFPEAAYVQTLRKGEVTFELAQRDATLDRRAKSMPLRPDEATVLNDYQDIALRARRSNAEALGAAAAAAGEANAAVAQARHFALVWAGHLLQDGLNAEAPAGNDVPPPLQTADETLMLHFLPEQSGWRVLACAGDRQFDYRVDGDSAAIARAVFDLRNEIVSQGPKWQALARELFDRMIGPVDHILSGVRNLAVTTDTPLGYLPFAALYDGRQCLIERVALWSATGLAPEKKTKRSGTPLRAALFGHEGRGPDRIAFVERELKAIADRHPGAQRVTPFTEERFAGALAQGADVVHVASHFHLEPGNPGRSYLALEDGPLTLDRFRSKRFPLSQTELFVLSACETAMADRGPFGLESFAALAQSKGARQVLGTLWRVSDASAAALMSAFYSGFGEIDDPAALASSLRDAQLALLRGVDLPEVSPERGGLSIPGRAAWRHPYHWAGYVLYG